MSCVSAEDTLHTGEHDMIFYTYIWTKLIQIFIIISLIFNEFHTVKCRYLIAFIPWPKGLGDIAMSLASVRTSVRPSVYLSVWNILWCSISRLECHLSFLHVLCFRRGYTPHWGAWHDILHLYLDKTDTNIHHYFFNIQWISYSKVQIPHRFYPLTERFGGYSDEPGICPNVRPPIRIPVCLKHYRVHSIT